MGGPKYARHFLREWRISRKFTLEQLAEALDVSHASLSRIERRLQPLGQPMVDDLAVILGTKRGSIFDEVPPGAENNLLRPTSSAFKGARAAQSGKFPHNCLYTPCTFRLTPIVHGVYIAILIWRAT